MVKVGLVSKVKIRKSERGLEIRKKEKDIIGLMDRFIVDGIVDGMMGHNLIK
jgi:hypothetical protein